MRTINSILMYKDILSEKDIAILKKLGYINGCGANGSFNFSAFLEKNIQTFYSFFPDNNFLKDAEKVCNEHDLDFMFFRDNFLGFHRANYRFVKKIFKLTHWTKMWQRLALSVVLFFLLWRFGKKAFKDSVSLNMDLIQLLVKHAK